MNNIESLKLSYEFGLRVEDGIHRALPDKFSMENKKPSKDFIVARDSSARAISFYSDNQWNWSHYHPYGASYILDFELWYEGAPSKIVKEITAEIKLVVFSIVWLSGGRRKSVTTVNVYLRLLNKLAKLAVEKKCSLASFLSDERLIRTFVTKYNDFYCVYLQSLFNMLYTVPNIGLDVQILPNKLLKNIAERSKNYYTSHKQHPPIPTAIFTKLLSNISRHLITFEDNADSLLSFVENILETPLKGQARKYQNKYLCQRKVNICDRIYEPIFSECIDSHTDKSLVNYLKDYGINSVATLTGHIEDIILLSKLSILAYTGARHIEVANLKFDCLELYHYNNKDHHLVVGITSKLNHGIAKKSKWVTSIEGVRGIKVAQKVSEMLYRVHNLGDKESLNSLLLLPTALARKVGDAPLKTEDYSAVESVRDMKSYISNSKKSVIRKDLMFTITDADIKELENVDMHRSWREEDKFQVGDIWSLTSHQFRRSLALYATTSGLVGLSSLRKQLQHISSEMSAYYTRGNSQARDILGLESDFIDEYRETVPESEALSYIKNVLMSDEKLFGSHGNWLSKHKSGSTNISLEERSDTLNRFKKGQLNYQETILGGCMGPKNCKDRALRSFVKCLGCSGATIALSKLDRVISSQQVVLDSVEPSSLYYRTEKSDLDIMLKVQARMKAKDGSK